MQDKELQAALLAIDKVCKKHDGAVTAQAMCNILGALAAQEETDEKRFRIFGLFVATLATSFHNACELIDEENLADAEVH